MDKNSFLFGGGIGTFIAAILFWVPFGILLADPIYNPSEFVGFYELFFTLAFYSGAYALFIILSSIILSPLGGFLGVLTKKLFSKRV